MLRLHIGSTLSPCAILWIDQVPIEAEAIIFDVGHTILFPEAPFILELARRHGGEMPLDAFDRLGAVAKAEAYSANPKDRYEQWFTRWMTGAGVATSALPAVFEALIERHREVGLWNSLEPTLPETFVRLRDRGFKLGVISNSDGTARQLLERHDVDQYFGSVIDSAIVGVEKPDARIFLLGAEELAVAPERCVYVGDQIEVDVRGSEAVRMQPVLIDPYGLGEQPPCPRITRLSEVLDLVDLPGQHSG